MALTTTRDRTGEHGDRRDGPEHAHATDSPRTWRDEGDPRSARVPIKNEADDDDWFGEWVAGPEP
jgi:hypothetical protein